jgi:phage-related protein
MSNLHLPNYTPIYPATKSVKPRQRKARLPDWGNEQRGTAGKNQTAPEWDLKWILKPIQANTLDLFLAEQAKTGAWFLWTPPGATQARFRCDEWSKQLVAPYVWEFQAKFRQVFSFALPVLSPSAGVFYLRAKASIFPRKGSFALTGNSATLRHNYVLRPAAALFAVSGAAITSARTYELEAGLCALQLNGKSPRLVAPGFVIDPITFSTTDQPTAVSIGLFTLNTLGPSTNVQLTVPDPTFTETATPSGVTLYQGGTATVENSVSLQLLVAPVEFT